MRIWIWVEMLGCHAEAVNGWGGDSAAGTAETGFVDTGAPPDGVADDALAAGP